MRRRTEKGKLSKELEKHGVLSSTELIPILGSRVAIKRKAEAGLLVALRSGAYASPSLDPFTASLLAASRYYPEAVISNFTAMVVHKLSDEAIDRIDVDIPKSKSLKNKLLKVHRRAQARLVGVTNLKYGSYPLRIYDKERTLCDAYLIDPAGPIFFSALKRYLKQGKADAARIAKYDKVLKTKVLIHLQQELADV